MAKTAYTKRVVLYQLKKNMLLTAVQSQKRNIVPSGMLSLWLAVMELGFSICLYVAPASTYLLCHKCIITHMISFMTHGDISNGLVTADGI